MRNLILILLVSCPILTVADPSGGGRGGWISYTVNEYERVFNLHYRMLSDDVPCINAKGKEKILDLNVNLAIYDIAQNSTTYLFETTSDESIIDVLFESGYNESDGSILFNNGSSSNYYLVRNNRGIEKRELSTMMIVITHSQSRELFTLWTCHKTGTDLKKVREYKEPRDLDIDMYNQCFLFFTETGGTIAIEKIKF
jgi:hypothetical protein